MDESLVSMEPGTSDASRSPMQYPAPSSISAAGSRPHTWRSWATITNLVVLTILAAAGALLAVVDLKARTDRQAALQEYRQDADQRARRSAVEVTHRLRLVHQGLRTIGLLPSVRRIDRHGLSIDADTRESIQQLYNNLVLNVDVAELHLVSADFDPQRIDPRTGRLEEPIMRLGEMVVRGPVSPLVGSDGPEDFQVRGTGGGAGEEYLAIEAQLRWLRANHPTDMAFEGIERPMLASPELTTRERPGREITASTRERAGLVLSVPFYNQHGILKGTISAVLRTRALQSYLPVRDHALINTAVGYRAFSADPGVTAGAIDHIEAATPDPGLFYSAVIPLDIEEPRGRWLLWAGQPDSRFLEGDAARSVRRFEITSVILIAFVTLAAIAAVLVTRSRIRLQRANREQLQELLVVRNAKLVALEQAQGELARSEERARHLAQHDVLTGLPNRALLHDRLIAACRCLGRDEETFALLCIDLDQFKIVNDTFGHQTGDELICCAATRLRRICRHSDTLARLGGDEFALVLTGCGTDAAEAVAKRIVEEMSRPIDLTVGQVQVGCSIGLTVVDDPAIDPPEALRRADLALYRAKNDGRGRFAGFSPELDAALRNRQALQSDLARALARGELDLAFQPQVDGDERIVGVEALVRWHHPDRGPVSPVVFIPIAEESGLVFELGLFVLRRAFAQAERWQGLQIGINVSAHQLRTSDFLARIAALVAEMAVDPRQFELEITEGVLLGDDQTTLSTLEGLRDMGFQLALDDFGTGYSSLGYLQRYPVDRIKIDRSFTKSIGVDKEAEAVVGAIVRLARALDLDVIAEGVETKEQRLALLEIGCTDAQGYLFGKPMPADQIDRLLPSRKAAKRELALAV